MWFSRLLLLSGATTSCAQSLQDILTAQSATLSTLNAWLASESLIFQIMSNAEGVTLLAPSNNALTQLYSTSLATDLALDPNLLTAFLAYHVLDGVYFMSDFADTPATSVPTFLNLAGYSNVTGGQVVASRSQDGNVSFISGDNVQSNIQSYDFNYVGGTLHIIDTPLTMPSRLTDTLVAGGYTGAVGAFRQVAIEEPLNDAADMTLFVPNNDAFNAIGSIINTMTLEQLTTVLNYHLVQGEVLYSQLIATGTQRTAEGANFNFRIENGELYVNSARVIATDILIANGVVHILDGVLNPANTTATPNPNAATQAPAFNGATTTTGGVPFTASVVTTTTASPRTTVPTASSKTPPTTTARPPATVQPGGAPEGKMAAGMAAMLGCAAMIGNL